MEEYKVEHYVEPELGYRERLSDKFKIGHLIYDRGKGCVIKVDAAVLDTIVRGEEKGMNPEDFIYTPLYMTDEWLVQIFHFEMRHLNTNNMTVFTSLRTGLKVHYQGGNYYLGYIFREKFEANGWLGCSTGKPRIMFINELMDYCFLIKRESIQFTDEEIDKINELIVI